MTYKRGTIIMEVIYLQSKIFWPKSWVRLICECDLYAKIYGIWSGLWLSRLDYCFLTSTHLWQLLSVHSKKTLMESEVFLEWTDYTSCFNDGIRSRVCHCLITASLTVVSQSFHVDAMIDSTQSINQSINQTLVCIIFLMGATHNYPDKYHPKLVCQERNLSQSPVTTN